MTILERIENFIFLSLKFACVCLVFFFLFLVMQSYLSLDDSKSYRGVMARLREEDVDSIIAYHNYNNTSCIDENYTFSNDIFDPQPDDYAVVKIKYNPNILFHKSITFGSENHIFDENIPSIMKLLSHSKCVKNVNFDSGYLTTKGIRIMCQVKSPRINFIKIKGEFDEYEIKYGDVKCLYKIEKSLNSITLVKPND